MAAERPDPKNTAGSSVRQVMRMGRRIAIAIAGGLLVVVGIILAMPLIPGPGLAIMALGLGVLSLEFERPRIWLAYLKRRFKDLAHRVRGKPPGGG